MDILFLFLPVVIVFANYLRTDAGPQPALCSVPGRKR